MHFERFKRTTTITTTTTTNDEGCRLLQVWEIFFHSNSNINIVSRQKQRRQQQQQQQQHKNVSSFLSSFRRWILLFTYCCFALLCRRMTHEDDKLWILISSTYSRHQHQLHSFKGILYFLWSSYRRRRRRIEKERRALNDQKASSSHRSADPSRSVILTTHHKASSSSSSSFFSFTFVAVLVVP